MRLWLEDRLTEPFLEFNGVHIDAVLWLHGDKLPRMGVGWVENMAGGSWLLGKQWTVS